MTYFIFILTSFSKNIADNPSKTCLIFKMFNCIASLCIVVKLLITNSKNLYRVFHWKKKVCIWFWIIHISIWEINETAYWPGKYSNINQFFHTHKRCIKRYVGFCNGNLNLIRFIYTRIFENIMNENKNTSHLMSYYITTGGHKKQNLRHNKGEFRNGECPYYFTSTALIYLPEHLWTGFPENARYR